MLMTLLLPDEPLIHFSLNIFLSFYDPFRSKSQTQTLEEQNSALDLILGPLRKEVRTSAEKETMCKIISVEFSKEKRVNQTNKKSLQNQKNSNTTKHRGNMKDIKERHTNT